MNRFLNFWLRPAVVKAYLLLFCVALVVVALKRPDPTWDTISYTSLAKEKDFESVEALHKDAFENLIGSIGEERFAFMLEQHHPKFRKAMLEDVKVFEQQLNFFRTRILFNNTVRLLYKTTGIDPRFGGTLVSSVCAALGFLVMALLFFDKVPRQALYLFPIVGIFFGVLSLARASSPDAMAFFFSALTCYAFVRNRWWLLFLALPLAVAARTDAIVWAGLMGAYLFVTQKGLPRWGSLLTVIVSYAVYKFANQTAGQYSWGVLIQNAFWEPLLYPADADGVITASHYLKVLAVGAASVVVEKELLVYLFLVLCVFGVVFTRSGFKGTIREALVNPWIGFIAISIAYIAAHFVLFPVLWYRFFPAQYIFMALLAISSVAFRPGVIGAQEKT